SRVTSNTTGIVVGSGPADTATLTATNDNFAGDTTGVQNNQSAGSVNATFDWWGSVTGPASATNPAGTGAKVGRNVAVSPRPGDTTIIAPEYLVFLSTAGDQYAVSSPGGGNIILSVSLGGKFVGSIPGAGTLGFAGTGGTIIVYGESGSGSTDVFNVGSK